MVMVDTTGDGVADSIAIDTTRDEQVDTIVSIALPGGSRRAGGGGGGAQQPQPPGGVFASLCRCLSGGAPRGGGTP